MKLTKKRKAELLEQYPNGNAIGRVIIDDYLNGERRKRGFDYDMETALNEKEIAFLIGTIMTEEDIFAYNKHVKFRDGIYTLMNIVSCLDNLFLSGYFHILQLIRPTMIGLDGYIVNPDSIRDNREISKRYKKAIKCIVNEAKNELSTAWENMTNGLRGLYFYDAVLETIGKIHNFNFDVIRPETKKRTDMFLDVRNEIHILMDIIIDYQKAAYGLKDAISIPHTFYELLNEVWNDDYKELQVKKEALDVLTSLIKKANINIPTIHAIINTMTDTPLHWGQFSDTEAKDG